MPLEGPDQLHLRAAAGYIELGMFDAANVELKTSIRSADICQKF
jgi:hypothetical protein